MQTSKRKILISALSYYESIIFLPYIYGLLKDQCKNTSLIQNNYEWLPPLFLGRDPHECIKNIDLDSVDVLGLSCYTWNWNMQVAIAQAYKQKNPEGLAVVGGPQPDWDDASFFKKYPQIDIVVKYDGEETFKKILLERLQPKPNYTSIPGLLLPFTSGVAKTAKPDRLQLNNLESVYWNNPEFTKIAADNKEKYTLGATLETNRGCPYRCTFCDWGSATFSKVRSFELERIKKDIDFFGEKKIPFIFISDANFGMFPRDLEIAKYLCHTRKKYGFPQFLYWPQAKNNEKRVFEITKLFHDNNFSLGVHIPIQTTNPHVLSEMGRSPRNLNMHKWMTDKCIEHNLPKVAQIILGSPGESLEDFKNCLGELLDWGFHEAFCVFLYQIFPNAPVSNHQYIKQHNIKTISRRPSKIEASSVEFDNPYTHGSVYLVAHNEMTEREWAEAMTYSSFIQCFHHFGPTYYISKYFNRFHGVSYKSFYKNLFNRIKKSKSPAFSAIKDLEKHYFGYTKDAQASLTLSITNNNTNYYEGDIYLFSKISSNASFFYEELLKVVESFSGIQHEPLKDLFSFQENSLISFDYHPETGRQFDLQYNWFNYFSSNVKSPYSDAEPIRVSTKASDVGKHFKVHLNWHNFNFPEAYYIQKIIPPVAFKPLFKPLFLREDVKIKTLYTSKNVSASI